MHQVRGVGFYLSRVPLRGACAARGLTAGAASRRGGGRIHPSGPCGVGGHMAIACARPTTLACRVPCPLGLDLGLAACGCGCGCALRPCPLAWNWNGRTPTGATHTAKPYRVLDTPHIQYSATHTQTGRVALSTSVFAFGPNSAPTSHVTRELGLARAKSQAVVRFCSRGPAPSRKVAGCASGVAWGAVFGSGAGEHELRRGRVRLPPVRLLLARRGRAALRGSRSSSAPTRGGSLRCAGCGPASARRRLRWP